MRSLGYMALAILCMGLALALYFNPPAVSGATLIGFYIFEIGLVLTGLGAFGYAMRG